MCISKIKRKTIFLALILTCLQACSSNWPHALHQARPEIGVSKAGRVLVVVRDARQIPGTVKPEFQPYYAGVLRQAIGDPIPLMTADGFTLASGIGQAICSSFTARGWACESAESDSKQEIKRELPGIINRYIATKILYVYVNQWQTEVSATSQVNYDINLTLWNRSLNLLSSVGEQGSRRLPTQSMFNPAENAAQGAPQVLSEILSGLLSDSKLIAKL